MRRSGSFALVMLASTKRGTTALQADPATPSHAKTLSNHQPDASGESESSTSPTLPTPSPPKAFMSTWSKFAQADSCTRRELLWHPPMKLPEILTRARNRRSHLPTIQSQEASSARQFLEELAMPQKFKTSPRPAHLLQDAGQNRRALWREFQVQMHAPKEVLSPSPPVEKL